MSSTKRVALVTGGARGIGLGISHALAQEGLHLALCGRRALAEVQEAMQSLRSLGVDVLYVQTDISAAAERNALLEAVRKHFGRLDVLVNNAGVAPEVRADLLETTEVSFERLIRINLQGPFFLTQAAVRWLLEEQAREADFRGCIVNISSISAFVASLNRGEYCLSKAALSMMTKLFAVRLAGKIPVYEIQPGLIRTDMNAGVQAHYDRLIAAGLLLEPRWGQPADIGKAVAMLVRGDVPYATGQTLTLDGGLTLQRL